MRERKVKRGIGGGGGEGRGGEGRGDFKEMRKGGYCGECIYFICTYSVSMTATVSS